MGRFVTLLFLSATLALFYVKFLRPREIISSLPPGEVTPIARLSNFVKENLQRVFGPLDGETSARLAQQIRQHRAAVEDRKAKVPAALQALHQGGMDLCDLLLQTLRERDNVNFSLIDTRSKPYSTALSPDELQAEIAKREFFEGGIQTRWAQSVAPYRKRFDPLFLWVRDTEQTLEPPTPVKPGN